jgi:hypothetical protein
MSLLQTDMTTAPFGIQTVGVFRAILRNVTFLFANEAAGKGKAAVPSARFAAVSQCMATLSTVEANVNYRLVSRRLEIFGAVFQEMTTFSASQTSGEIGRIFLSFLFFLFQQHIEKLLTSIVFGYLGQSLFFFHCQSQLLTFC